MKYFGSIILTRSVDVQNSCSESFHVVLNLRPLLRHIKMSNIENSCQQMCRVIIGRKAISFKIDLEDTMGTRNAKFSVD